MKKLYYKLLRKLGIRFCNGCGSCIWWSRKTLRFIDSPKDEYGYVAPACDICIVYAENEIY